MNDGPQNNENPVIELAEFVSKVSYSDLSDDMIRLAERCFIDTVGVTLAGVTDGAGLLTARVVERWKGETPIPGRDATAALPEAVFSAATAGHCHDFDDVSLEAMDGHPSVTMIAPILAVAAEIDATGKDAITAYVAGFETQCFIAAPISPGHYEGGWHATGTFGTFGAAAAVANLLNHSFSQIINTLNIAASMTAGLKHNFGTMTKPMHAGQAARSGLTAAYLAAEGFTASPCAISGPQGFFNLYGGMENPDLDTFPELGKDWSFKRYGVDVKKYPCCYYTHAAISGTLALVEAYDLSPNDICSVRVVGSRGAADALQYDDPTTGTEGKFSMHYVIASAIVNRCIDITTFHEDVIIDQTTQEIRPRVEFDVDSELSYDANTATITVELADGSLLEHRQEEAPGTNANPLSDSELHEKFMKCATQAVPDGTANRTLSLLDSLRDQTRLDSILKLH